MTLRRAAGSSVSQGVVGAMCTIRVTDGLGKIGVLVALESAGQGGRAGRARHAARDACRGRQSAGARCRRASIRPSSQREKDVLADKFRAAGQARHDDRQDRRIGPRRPSTRKSACSIRPSSSTTTRPWRRRVKEAEGKVGGADQGHRLSCAMRSARASRRPESDFAAEVAAAAGAEADRRHDGRRPRSRLRRRWLIAASGRMRSWLSRPIAA